MASKFIACSNWYRTLYIGNLSFTTGVDNLDLLCSLRGRPFCLTQLDYLDLIPRSNTYIAFFKSNTELFVWLRQLLQRNHWNLSNLKPHPYAIFTRPSWWPSIILETTQPGDEATLKTHAALGPKKFQSILSCMCLDSGIKAIESIIMSMKYLSSYWCLISDPNTGIFQVLTSPQLRHIYIILYVVCSWILNGRIVTKKCSHHLVFYVTVQIHQISLSAAYQCVQVPSPDDVFVHQRVSSVDPVATQTSLSTMRYHWDKDKSYNVKGEWGQSSSGYQLRRSEDTNNLINYRH